MPAPLAGPVEPGAAGGRGDPQKRAEFPIGQAVLIGQLQQGPVPGRQLPGQQVVQTGPPDLLGGGQPGQVDLPRLVPGTVCLAGKLPVQLVPQGDPQPPAGIGVGADLAGLVQKGEKDLLGQVPGQLRVLQPVFGRPVQVGGIGFIEGVNPIFCGGDKRPPPLLFGYPFSFSIPPEGGILSKNRKKDKKTGPVTPERQVRFAPTGPHASRSCRRKAAARSRSRALGWPLAMPPSLPKGP